MSCCTGRASRCRRDRIYGMILRDVRSRLGLGGVALTTAFVLLGCGASAPAGAPSSTEALRSVPAEGVLDGVRVDAGLLDDGSVCSEADWPEADWVVKRDCWTPPFVHYWDLVAFGRAENDPDEPFSVALLVSSFGAEIDAIEQLGIAVTWHQYGPAVIVVSDSIPNGSAPLEIDFTVDADARQCSLGPPEIVCRN